MLHKEQGTGLAGHIIVTDHPIPADPCGVTEPGGETDQGIVTGLGKLARGVGVADFDGRCV